MTQHGGECIIVKKQHYEKVIKKIIIYSQLFVLYGI